MSMVGNFRLLSETDSAVLLGQPWSVSSLLYGEEAIVPKTPLWKKLFRARKTVPQYAPADPEDELYLDKAWHGIHFLITDLAPLDRDMSDEPLAFIVANGVQVGEVDVGYGPARLFSAQNVAAIALKLKPIARDNIKAKCDATAFRAARIYPDLWDLADDEGFDYLLDCFEQLKAFVLRGKQEGKSLVVYFN